MTDGTDDNNSSAKNISLSYSSPAMIFTVSIIYKNGLLYSMILKIKELGHIDSADLCHSFVIVRAGIPVCVTQPSYGW